MAAQKLSVPWDRLKAWIAEQESAEQQGRDTMARPQLAALSHIVDFVEPEPDVSGRDYVSLLMREHPPPT